MPVYIDKPADYLPSAGFYFKKSLKNPDQEMNVLRWHVY